MKIELTAEQRIAAFTSERKLSDTQICILISLGYNRGAIVPSFSDILPGVKSE